MKTAMAQKDPPLRPYLKWAGGKRQLLSEIGKYLPGDGEGYTYYEPFVGAGAVLFALRPARAVINDSNAQLMLTYAVVKENVEGLIALLKKYQDRNGEDFFYGLRDMDRDPGRFNGLTDTEKAARLIFLNKTCFNGLYRVNARGFFNVPRGKYKNPLICDETALRRIGAYLNANEITLLNGDFEDAVEGAGGNSFLYFDPPYHSPGSAGFTGYQADGFGADGQRRLRDLMLRMTGRGAKCLLSNTDTEYIRALYDRDCFHILPVQARRTINADSSGRGSVGEILVKNW
jgi:DNA adenine methylase